MYQFSKNSRYQLRRSHPDLQKILEKSLELSDVDFGISKSYRSVRRQKELYAQGRTKPGNIVTHIDGVNKKSKHNYNPSKAVDIYAWIGRVSYDTEHLSYIAGVILTVAKELYEKGEVDHEIRWGGNWDRDGQIIIDQNLIDLPHFEII